MTSFGMPRFAAIASSASCCIGVSVMPGDTALTRMLRGARAWAKERVIDWMAVFVAAYTAASVVEAERADGDEQFTIAPPSFRCWPRPSERNHADSRFVA